MLFLNNLFYFYCRFAVFRRCLDAEMKDSTRKGVSLQTKKSDKEAVTDEEEEKFWSAGLFGSATAKTLLDTIYFYNGKLFGLRGGEHRNICVNNFSWQDYRITPYINYAYALLWKKNNTPNNRLPLGVAYIIQVFFNFFLSLFGIRPKMSNFKKIFRTNTPSFGFFDVKCERKSGKPSFLRQRLAIKWGLRKLCV